MHTFTFYEVSNPNMIMLIADLMAVYILCSYTKLYIFPFRPSINDLVIKGLKLPIQPPPKKPNTPVITIDIDIGTPEENLSHVYALKINNSLFLYDQPGQSLTHLKNMKKGCWYQDCSNWNYYFNVPVKKIGRSKLFLQNLGTVAIRYCWKKLRKLIPYIPEDRQEMVFFFNKNEDIISPGQSKEIILTFLPDKLGIYSEFWELVTINVSFFDDKKETFVLNLYADVVENVELIKNEANNIKNNIICLSHINIVKSIVEDAIMKATSVQPQTYFYENKILEGDIFVMKNPVCFYHQTEVQKMKDIYREMLPEKEWDLCIGSWRKSMMEKEFDDRMKYYEILRKSHEDLLKPWSEGDTLLEEKRRIVRRLLSQLAVTMDKEYARIKSQIGIKNGLDLSQEEIYEDPLIFNTIHALFYMSIRDHINDIIESCAGILSSLDLNRWIDFNFCR